MKRGDDYDQIKNAIGHHMWEQVCELYPQLRDKVSFFLRSPILIPIADMATKNISENLVV